MTLEDLEAAGYQRFTGAQFKLADFGMQKCIYCHLRLGRNDTGTWKAYFITVYCYDRSKYPDAKDWPERYRWGFQPEVHFYLDELGDRGFEVTLAVGDEMTVAEMEGFFEEVYGRMECVPDAHNN